MNEETSPAPESVADAVEKLERFHDVLSKPRPMCRDCADEDGVCPNIHLPCGLTAKQVRLVLNRLAAVDRMLGDATRIRFSINDDDRIIEPDWDRDSNFWVEVDDHGNRIGKTTSVSALEAYEQLRTP